MSNFTQSSVEDGELAWLESLGHALQHGTEIASGEPTAERSDSNYRDGVLEGPLCQTLGGLKLLLEESSQ